MHALHRRSIAVLTVAALAASCGGSDDASTDTMPVETDPPVTEPVATEPPVTEPVATEPPVTEPPATDPPVTEPLETEPPADESDDIELDAAYGEYEVGVQTVTLPDQTDGGRDLTVDVWFPIDQNIDFDANFAQYTLIEGTYYESPFALDVGPESIATDGPFPLVIYSHGSGGIRYIDSHYTEALASNGYIVAAPDHTGNTAADRLLGSETDGTITAFNRPNDVRRVIDAMLDPESAATVGFVASVNPSQIGVTGHSFGGFTAYAMASGFSNEVGEFVADERVSAILPLAPATNGLSDELLASIDIPAMVIVGTNDQTTPADPNVDRPWELSSSSPSYRLDLVDAEHETFTDLCAYQAFMPTLPDVLPAVVETINSRVEAGCGDEDMPIERAQAITNTFAVAFFDEIFKGGEPIALDQVDEQTDFTYQIK